MTKDRKPLPFDRELEAFPQAFRWCEWMRRIEAVLFATSRPVAHEDLARVVGKGASIDLLIEDLRVELAERSFDAVRVSDGWMLQTRSAYTPMIQAAANVSNQFIDLKEFDVAVLAAIAYHQPITRDGLKGVFGKEISRDVIRRLQALELITNGPRSPRRGAPYTYVTTDVFLMVYGLASLRDLPDREQLQDAGLLVETQQADTT